MDAHRIAATCAALAMAKAWHVWNDNIQSHIPSQRRMAVAARARAVIVQDLTLCHGVAFTRRPARAVILNLGTDAANDPRYADSARRAS